MPSPVGIVGVVYWTKPGDVLRELEEVKILLGSLYCILSGTK